MKIISLSIVLFILFFCSTCSDLRVEKLYSHGMIATASPTASEIGLDVLRSGGNAFDAAVAVGFALAVCYPEAGNIGGGGFAMIYSSESGDIRALDFRETAPGASTRDMYLDQDNNVIPKSSLLGARAVGTPGTVSGLYKLWDKYGSRDWYELLKPSIKLADTGYIVSEYQAKSFAGYEKEFRIYLETDNYLLKNGRAYRAGERLVQNDLSRALDRIGRDRLEGFYSGETADLIVACMEKNGGLISAADLAGYDPVWREPIHIKFDSLDIYSMPPPSSGGVILGQILKLVEPFDFSLYTVGSVDYIHLFTEACRLAYADRAVHLGDPDFHDNPIDELLDKNYVDSRRNLIDYDQAGSSEEVTSGIPNGQILPESESTTHFCIGDKWGNIVSITYTINASYGSKLMVDGAGFLLNNEMDDFSIKPGTPNLYGLIGGEANAIEPKKRMLSSMSPTIVMKRGEPVLALGAPGGSKIITTVAEAIIAYSRFVLRPHEIVDLPRFHHQWLPDTLYLEEGRFDSGLLGDLRNLGHNVKEREKYSDLQIISLDNNSLYNGASDPRKDGAALGY